MVRIFGWIAGMIAWAGTFNDMPWLGQSGEREPAAVWGNIGPFTYAKGAEGISGVTVSLKAFPGYNRLSAIALQPQAWWMFMLALLPVLITLAIVYIARKKLQQRLQQQNEQLERQREQIAQMNLMLKLKILQARMNPHFLFNSLNAVQYFINADDKKTALQYVSRFSAFLRKMIQHGDDIAISLRDEADLINDYLVLEQARFPDRFTYEIDLPEELWLEDIPPFLTHSLLEDALYKGVLNLAKDEPGKITVALRAQGNGLVVEVTDNGISFTRAEEPDDKRDMLNKRIQLYNQQNIRQVSLAYRTGVRGENGWLNKAVLTIT